MNFKMRLAGLMAFLVAAVALSIVPAEAQRRGGPAAANWVKLGEQRVGFNVDRDTIQVGRQEGRFRAVKLVVRGADIFVIDMKVTYGNGQSEDLVVNAPIRAGTETRALDLAGEARFISQVDFIYRARPGFSGRATVELFGLSDDGRGGPGPGAGYGGPPPTRVYGGEIPRGLVLFGTQTVGFQAERDVLRLGRDVGRFSKIALRVLRNDIYLREMVVRYSGGETQRLPINAEIQANGVTQPIDIRDGRIDQIEFIYQARPGFRGQAVVEVYGEHASRWVGEGGGGRGQWVLLGAQRADMFSNDRDVFQVGRQLGAFRQVKVRAAKHAIILQGMRITYSNGESEDVSVPRDLAGGQETPPIDLRGRERFIESIEMRYKSRFNLKGDATVELYGLH
ncbi:MAG: hypothetical protein ACKVP7_12685 [Hyphomicrobiaceae bacterium]